MNGLELRKIIKMKGAEGEGQSDPGQIPYKCFEMSRLKEKPSQRAKEIS